jgi:hypothetical protein
MRRILVVGGTGFFGRAAVELLRERGLSPVVAARGPHADLRLDAEDPASLRAALRRGDVVIDAAGPFQERSAALVEAAAGIHCDVIDISDSIDHLLAVEALRPRVEAAGIRVLTSCSSITTLAALLVRGGRTAKPVRISVCLAPAARETARAGTGASLLHSLGRPVRVFRDGRLATASGWRESRPFRMPAPIGPCRGYLMESVQAVTFPRLWPTLRQTEFWVDSRVKGMNGVLALAARWSPLRRAIGVLRRRGGTSLARLLGSSAGGMLVEVESADGSVSQVRILARRRSYLAAVAPAILAASDFAADRGPARGFVPHDRHVDPSALIRLLRECGIEVLSA